jgi:NADP-dependent 3-hydroxy acid dehydrogenase YdfG
MRLDGKITLITGASAGIGEACAVEFAKAGSNLILTARRLERIEKLAEMLAKEYNVKCLPIELDVRNNNEVESKLQNLPEEFKSVDILINNAGKALGMDNIQNGSLDDWEEMIDTNIKGLLYVTRVVAPLMVERGNGMIINIASIAGRQVYPKGNVYCATKSAVRTLSEAMVVDLNGTGVRVCNVDPGLVETEFSLVRFHGDAERAGNTYKGYTPLTGKDIADIVLFTATRPPHVMIHDILVTSIDQASTTIVNKR